jgi:hypothetical protein
MKHFLLIAVLFAPLSVHAVGRGVGEVVDTLKSTGEFEDTLIIFLCNVGARRDQWKICREGNGSWKLYDLEEDIGEQRDSSSENVELHRSMVSEVEQWSQGQTHPDGLMHWKLGTTG